MKILRFMDNGASRVGILDGDTVYDAGTDLFGSLERGRAVGSLDALMMLPPVAPRMIVAVGKNYSDHIAEMARGGDATLPEEPVLFLKPPTALLPHGGEIRMMPGTRTDYEAELCMVIGREAHRVAEADAFDYVLGYTCGNDVSNRGVTGQSGQWTRGKGYDTFCPLGPVIETELDPNHLRIQSRLNGEVRQNTTIDTMIFKPAFLVSFISNVMTLLPGDVIMTGTPEGVSTLTPGDTIEVELEGIGTLRNRVVARE
ncbi:MAG TPA: fumarylacetoacetate hydrolase family protein [Nitrolancea sp.]|nr:fumarylacetoacetate hydrolase family protein [Nitrolancea sp.]